MNPEFVEAQLVRFGYAISYNALANHGAAISGKWNSWDCALPVEGQKRMNGPDAWP
jgi:hypothetical protein